MLNQHFCAFLLNNFIGSSDPNLTNNTIFFIRRSRRVRIFDPFRNLMTSKILDFTGYKGLTCNYKGFSYYDVIKKFPHAGLMRTFQISKKGVIYFRKNAKPRSTNFFPGSFIEEPLLTPLYLKIATPEQGHLYDVNY